MQSKKIAVILIIILTITSLAGVLIPQEAQNKGAYDLWTTTYPFLVPVVTFLGLHKVFGTPWFLILVLVFLINLAACTWGQINRLFRLWYGLRQNGQPLSKRFWAIFGNCFFHVGLVIIVMGGLLTLGYKMGGYVEIAEGETFVEKHENYLAITEGLFFNEDHLGFQVMLNKQTRYFKENGQLDYVTSRITVSDNGREIVFPKVERGQPITYRGITFYHFRSGFAPYITIKDSGGQALLEGYALFNSMWHNKKGEYSMDLAIAGTDLLLKAKFYPNATSQYGMMVSKSSQALNPVIQAAVMKKGKLVGRIQFKPGQDAVIEGMTIGMGDIRYWTGYEVSRDPGAGVIFTGFLVSLGGIVISFTFKSRGREEEDYGHRITA
ncbi:MAG: cytochrome c biogenesis protein ResB [Clostridia bacterium]|nr:cytochrome c biogenesis protein ResB [Clostridia bacterium]